MSCLKIDEIYAYIDDELGARQRQDIKEHLGVCAKCREAVEKRRLIGEAASCLAPLEVPSDFAQQVMARIASKSFALPVWLTAAVIGLSSLGLICLVLVASGGRNALTLLSYVHHSFWAAVKNMMVLTAKLMTALSLVGKAVGPLGRSALKGFSLLTTLISPELQILIITSTLITLTALFYALRKKILLGE